MRKTIPILVCLLYSFCVSVAKATVTRANVTSGVLSSTGTITNATIAATTAGNMLVVALNASLGSQTTVSITDGGDTFHYTGCRGTNSSGAGTNTEIWYAINVLGSVTSLTITRNAIDSNADDFFVAEYNSDHGSSFVFDVCNQTTNLASTATPIGASVTTTGTNDVIVANMTDAHASATGTLANGGDTFNNVSNFNGNGFADLLVAAAGAHAPQWQLSGSDATISEATASFKESTATLSSIAVTPANSSILVGGAKPFTATGTFSDSSTLDITATSTWSSSDVTKVTINSSTGLATGIAIGATTIQATKSSINGTTPLRAIIASLNIYGGDTAHACVGTLPAGGAIPGATGYFYLYKDTNLTHWMWCDPLGRRWWMTGLQVVDYGGDGYTAIANAKYGTFGSATGWESSQAKRLQTMGFNTVGEFSRKYMWPPIGSNPTSIPFIYKVGPETIWANSIKDVFANLPPHWDVVDGYRGFASFDFYDPLWQAVGTGVGGSLANQFCVNDFGTCANADASPWLVSIGSDDVGGVRVLDLNQGTYVIGITAPYEQFENSNGYGRRQVFSSPVMASKSQWGTWLCNTRYANLVALNAAWGSTYTSCGSTASTSGTETIGTGNGATTSFNVTLAHTPVDPASIGISVGGVLQGGDTPWFNATVCTQSSGVGCIQAATGNINGGTVTYSSGVITVTFSVAPANGVAITASYQYGGWPKATSGGTGIMDEDGTSSWWPAGGPRDTTAFPDPPVTTITTDMDVFLNLVATQYLHPVYLWIKANFPHHMAGSTDQAGPAYRNQIYTAMAANADVLLYGNTIANNASVVMGSSGWSTPAVSQYNLAAKPIYVGVYAASNPDSQFNASGCPYNAALCFATQDLKGAFYLSQSTYAFNNVVGADTYGFIVGTDYWQYIDNNGEQGAYGLVSLKDNLYCTPNGNQSFKEDVNSSIIDWLGFTTTAEAATYGNFCPSVKTANAIWLGNQVPATGVPLGRLP